MLSLLPGALSVAALLAVREHRYNIQLSPTSGRAQFTPRALLGAWRQLDARLRGFLLVTFLFTLENSSNQFLLLRAGQLGMNSGQVLLLYGSYNAMYSLLSYPAGRLSDHIGRRALLIAGYAVYGIVYLGFVIASGARVSGRCSRFTASTLPVPTASRRHCSLIWPRPT